MPAGLDWSLFLETAHGHGVLTTFAPLIDADGRDADTEEALAWLKRTAGLRNGIMLLELERWLPEIEAAECRPIVLKGAALAQTVYASPELRTFADLDILVPIDRVDRTCEVLAARGYRLLAGKRDPRFYERHHFHRIMTNSAGVCCEIHWALTQPRSCYQFDLEGFRGRTTELDTGRGTMRIPAAGDQLLHGAMQCIADGFSDLRRVVDAALLLPHVAAGDEFVARARRQGLGTGLWLLLESARRLTGAEVPAVLWRDLRPGGFRGRCLEALDVPGACLHRDACRDNGLNPLLHILCTPGGPMVGRELGRWFWPRGADLFDAGFVPGRDRALPLWMSLAWYRLYKGLRAGGHLGWRLLRGPRRTGRTDESLSPPPAP